MSDGGFGSWAASEGGAEGAHEIVGSAPEERRAMVLARDDSALLNSHYDRRGLCFSGLSQIVEFGLGFTGGSDWLRRAGPLAVADVVASEVQAASERLNTGAPTDAKFHILHHQADVAALPDCDLLYSVLSLRHTRAAVLARVLDLILAKVVAGGVALLRVPTQHKLYQFMLPGARALPELDVIPQWKLFEMLEANGFSIVLAQQDPLVRMDDLLFHTILAQR
jgi:hypothetical protein